MGWAIFPQVTELSSLRQQNLIFPQQMGLEVIQLEFWKYRFTLSEPALFEPYGSYELWLFLLIFGPKIGLFLSLDN